MELAVLALLIILALSTTPRRGTLLIAVLSVLRALELATLFALTTRRAVALRAAHIVRAHRAAAHERRRTLTVAVLSILRALELAARRTVALRVTAIVGALMTAAHEGRRTLLLTVLSTLHRRRAHVLSALTTGALLALATLAHMRRERRTFAVGAERRRTLHMSTLRATGRRAHVRSTLSTGRQRRTFTLRAVGVVRAVMTVMHTGRRALLVAALVVAELAAALMGRGRRRSAGVLRRRVERRETECERGRCD